MKEPNQKNGGTCRFPVINFVLADGGDGLLPPPYRTGGELHYKDSNFSLTKDPYQNNHATCGTPVADLNRGTVTRSLTFFYQGLWGGFYPPAAVAMHSDYTKDTVSRHLGVRGSPGTDKTKIFLAESLLIADCHTTEATKLSVTRSLR